MRTDFRRRVSNTLILSTTNFFEVALLFLFVFCHCGTLSRGLMTFLVMVFSGCIVSTFRFRIDAAFFLSQRNLVGWEGTRKKTPGGKNQLGLIIIEK